jgi:FGGY-family pentulose kinase
MMTCYIGIDVGTASARAGVFDGRGTCLATAQRPITVFRPAGDFAQQSSAEIWSAVAQSIREAIGHAGVPAATVAAVGFDATCSLVVTGQEGRPVSVSPDSAADQDIIMWMDHRAMEDAAAINATGAEVLRYVGGVISPEMEMPKLRWLKRNLPGAWQKAVRFWDLPDWLVHRATGSQDRSLCSSVCKWTYLGHKGVRGEGWDDQFLAAIGLEDLTGSRHEAIGTRFLPPGTLAGRLGNQAAGELGLPVGTPVAAGMIDAYAGALGTLSVSGGQAAGRLAMIAGTSTCHISVSPSPHFVPGVWGPYFSVLMPGMWANEGGQSAAGALIDAVIARHAASRELRLEAEKNRQSIHALLETRLAAQGGETAFLTRNRHVQPDFHGNRSPLAEPWRHGAIDGLSLETGLDDLALDYLATLQALAYGTRHIIEEMRATGMAIDTIVVSGGLARNGLFLRENADATGCTLLVPDTPEPVLLGSAMMGAVAYGQYPDLPAAMAAMSGGGQQIVPRGGAITAFHDRKYAIMRRMQQDHADYAAIMKETMP